MGGVRRLRGKLSGERVARSVACEECKSKFIVSRSIKAMVVGRCERTSFKASTISTIAAGVATAATTIRGREGLRALYNCQ